MGGGAVSLVNGVRVAVYRSFIDASRAPEPEDVADQLGCTLDDVTAALRELHEQDVIVLRPGTASIWLAHPFCDSDAPFEVAAQDQTWDAICIWDALGILSLLKSDGT